MSFAVRKRGEAGRHFLFRKPALRGCLLNGMDQKGHVPGKRAHGLKAFCVLAHIIRGEAVYIVPVLAGYHGMPQIVKYLLITSKDAVAPARRQETTLAPHFMVLSKCVE